MVILKVNVEKLLKIIVTVPVLVWCRRAVQRDPKI